MEVTTLFLEAYNLNKKCLSHKITFTELKWSIENLIIDHLFINENDTFIDANTRLTEYLKKDIKGIFDGLEDERTTEANVKYQLDVVIKSFDLIHDTLRYRWSKN